MEALRAILSHWASGLSIGTYFYSGCAYFKNTFQKIMKQIKMMKMHNVCLTSRCTWIFNPVKQET